MSYVYKGYIRSMGFSLVELMIVVVIIGLLVAVAVPKFAAYRDRTSIAAALASLESVRAAMASYAANSKGNTFPRSITTYSHLTGIINPNGGSLKDAESDQGFMFRAYTPNDNDNDNVVEHYTMSFVVIGVPPEKVGAAIRVGPSSLDKIAR